MNTTPVSRRSALLSLAALAAPAFLHAAPALPGDSIYWLDATLEDQDGRRFALSSLQGTPLLASMFYTSCDMVCPMIFETVHATLRALPARERDGVRVLMVSFDPQRDTVEVLKKTAQAHGCDARWTLARCDEATARQVAAVLGIQYRRLAGGDYNHSSVVEAIDARGRIAARSGKLGTVDPSVLAALRSVPSGGVPSAAHPTRVRS
jgi:protein SCO1/2